mmetsp:Transcript_30241/g.58367  ORF Transcript_30241/g.58367 Transcript_30241/m.58367 type:complete len:263 (+) Transcript_30241:695-1483(+)
MGARSSARAQECPRFAGRRLQSRCSCSGPRANCTCCPTRPAPRACGVRRASCSSDSCGWTKLETAASPSKTGAMAPTQTPRSCGASTPRSSPPRRYTPQLRGNVARKPSAHRRRSTRRTAAPTSSRPSPRPFRRCKTRSAASAACSGSGSPSALSTRTRSAWRPSPRTWRRRRKNGSSSARSPSVTVASRRTLSSPTARPTFGARSTSARSRRCVMQSTPTTSSPILRRQGKAARPRPSACDARAHEATYDTVYTAPCTKYW